MKPFFIFLLLPVFAFTQFKTEDTPPKVYFTKVYEIDSTPKATIHNKALEWVATSYNDANNVIKLNTEDKVIVRGGFKIVGTIEGFANYNLIISFKDNKYKVDMDSFIIEYHTQYGSNKINAEDYLNYLSFEDYLNHYKKMADTTANKTTKRFLEKRIKEPEKLRSEYDMGKENSIDILKQIKEYSEATAADLYKYITVSSTPKKDDW